MFHVFAMAYYHSAASRDARVYAMRVGNARMYHTTTQSAS